MTNNAADNDNEIALTPISVLDPADRERASRRRKILAGAVAVLVVAGGITAWAVTANSGDSTPTKHTAVIPKTFGTYTEAKDGDTEFVTSTRVNTDITQGDAWLTYRAAGDKAAKITVTLDPPAYTSDDGTEQGPGSDSETASLLHISNAEKITDYPAGKQGGKIQCADITTNGRTYTNCAWQSKEAEITYTPLVKHIPIADQKQTTSDFRSFLDALKIEPKKS